MRDKRASLLALQSRDSFCASRAAYGRQPVASITIRNLDDDVKTRLRVRAAEHGRSMEE